MQAPWRQPTRVERLGAIDPAERLGDPWPYADLRNSPPVTAPGRRYPTAAPVVTRRYRRYFADRTERLRPYAGGTIGVAVVSEIDAALAAPEAGLTRYAADFYDGTAASTLGVNVGVLWALTDRVDLNEQLGFRFLSSLTQIDGLVGTGLEETNDKSARWTLPIVLGVRFKF